MAEREVLIDSRATDNFISPQLLKQLGISTLLVKLPIHIWNVDGTHNQGGAITHYTDLKVRTGEQKKTLRFLITNLGREEVILGYPWFTAFKPKFHLARCYLGQRIPSSYCLKPRVETPLSPP